MRTLFGALVLAIVTLAVGCDAPAGRALAPRTQTFAELRVVRRGVTVVPPDEPERTPVPRERLVDGEVVKLAAGGLAWLRRDAGATLLVAGPASVRVLRDAVEVDSGKVFIDAPSAEPTRIVTRSAPLLFAKVRASLEVDAAGAVSTYVLSGEVRAEPQDAAKVPAAAASLVARAGEELHLAKDLAGEVRRIVAWEDWTGGLATTDRSAAPPPFGVGTVGARPAGDLGAPRTPLVIQSLDVRVTIAGDFATTEVDEEFFNPQSQTVEGIYRMRVPRGASLERFGVDRMGAIAWGYVKEKAQAAAQYQSHVYQGSTEDPALLQWVEPGVFEAKLYPLGPGATRRVVTRWTEWLPRGGKKGERRLYVYPMAAEGAEGSLPVIEEMTATIDLLRAGALEVRAGLDGVRDGDSIVIRRQDFVPRADLAIELFDAGTEKVQAIRAPHRLDAAVLAPSDRARAEQMRASEPDYLLVPVRPDAVKEPEGGLDLAIVVDTSAATDDVELALARAAATSLLAHLGKDDRVAVFAADDRLRPALAGSGVFGPVDEAKRRDIGRSLADLQQGGATDLGAVLAEASAKLDPARRGAVVYIGDGAATVGERSLTELRARLAKLPRPARTFALATGDGADLALLEGVSQGGFAARVTDGSSAARAALAILENAERPALLRASVDLGPGVERIYPRDLGALVADESIVLVGRLSGDSPQTVTVTSPAGQSTLPLEVKTFDDHGDLRRRWAESRLELMIENGDGRAALVDLGVRQGIITPVTSFYVPTAAEMSPQEVAELRQRAQNGEMAARNDKRRKAQSIHAEGNDVEGERGGAKSGERDAAKEQDEEPSKPGFFSRLAKGGKDEAAKAEPAPQAVAAATAAPAAPPPLDAPAEAPPEMKSPAPAKPSPADPTTTTPAPATAASASAADAVLPERSLRQEAEKRGGVDQGIVTGTGQGFGSGSGRLGGMHRTREDDGQSMDKQLAEVAANEAPQGGAKADLDGRFANSIPPLGGSEPLDMRLPSLEPMLAGGLGLSGIGEGGGGRGEGIGLGSIGNLSNLGNGKMRLAEGDGFADAELARRRDSTGRVDDSKSKAKGTTNEPFGDRGGYRVTVGVTVAVGDRLGRRRLGCGGAADAPLSERMALWRERLAKTGGNPNAVASVYRSALMRCEAPGPRERTLLLGFLLDALPTPSRRVQLWRQMQGDLGAASVLYRGLLARVRTADEARELSAALGLRTAPPESVDRILKEAKNDSERADRLRALSAMWPDDHDLALRLLDALEDAKDAAAARALGHRLRRRADVDARVRTAVGELHLRLAAVATDPEAKSADEQEARRAFGEIVEFSPDDPAARRRLGDLLRAHAWFEEAARQYETLAALLPDDPGVALLRGAAAEGRGLLEDAVKFAEKGISSGPPDARTGPAATARALAATFLAWGQLAAQERNDAAEGDRLSARKARMLPTSADATSIPGASRTRVAAVWSHPDLHPTLWSNALGTPLPTTEGDPALGVAQVDGPTRSGNWIELRVDPLEVERVARLGAEIDVLFAIAEGSKEEHLVRKKVRFARGGPAELRFSTETGEPLEIPSREAVREVRP